MKSERAVNLAVSRAAKEAVALVQAGYYLTPVTLTRNLKGEKVARFHAKWRTDGGWSDSPEQVRDWSAQHACSFAIVCGPSNVEGVDLDVKPDKDVDAVAWWANEGLPMGLLMVETPSGGIHTYWRRRRAGRRLPTSAGEVAPGVDTRSVGGLFFAPGAFVLDINGDPEEVGYRVMGDLVAVDDLTETPNEVLDAWSLQAATPEKATTPGQANPDRCYTEEQAEQWILERAVNPLKNAVEGERNDALNTAAFVFGQFIPEFDYDQDEVTGWLEKWAEEKGLSPEEIGPTIRSGLNSGMRLPHTKVDEPVPFARADASGGVGESAYEKELNRERIRRQVRAELDAEGRAPLSRLSFMDFFNASPPEYLVPNMFYADGLSVVFGPPGAAKSFLLLDIALCIATGSRWRGEDLGRAPVHYVMAEGKATNTLRTHAWFTHNKVDPKLAQDFFIPYDEPIMLTRAGLIDYLVDVRKDRPAMIILDTKNLMFSGKESQGDDYGEMLRALHSIRQAAGGAAVVLIDHSGLTDDSRTRGSNAQKGGVETEIKVSDENGVRKAVCTRDKSGEIGTEWIYKLVQVPEVLRPRGVTAPAVCVPADAATVASSPFRTTMENWSDPILDLPRDIVTYSGAGASALKELARFMRYNGTGEVGPNLQAARKAVRETYRRDGKPVHSESTINRAWEALIELQRLRTTQTDSPISYSVWVEKENDPI